MAKAKAKVRIALGELPPDPDPTLDTYTLIGNVSSGSGPNVSKSEIEHSDFDSLAKEFFGDLPDPGEISFTANRNFGNTGQTTARTDAYASGQQRNCRVQMLDASDDTVLETIYALIEVMEWSEDWANAQQYTVAARFKISGAPTYA